MLDEQIHKIDFMEPANLLSSGFFAKCCHFYIALRKEISVRPNLSFPVLTVVIPTRHRDEMLSTCLSQLNPELQGVSQDTFRVIVTDDGTETTSQRIIAENFAFVEWTQGPRRGPAANRNHGARIAQSPWIVFLDDDCIPLTNWLRGYLEAIESDTQANKSFEIYEGRTICSAGVQSPMQHSPVNEEGGWLWSCNLAVRRDFFNSIGGFDEEYPYPHMEDVDFRERAYGVNAQSRFVKESVVDHPPRLDNFVPKYHESEFLMYHKMRSSGDFRWRALCLTINFRLRTFWAYRKHPDSIKLLHKLFPEVLYIFRHAPEWSKKYSARYAGTVSPFAPDTKSRLRY